MGEKGRPQQRTSAPRQGPGRFGLTNGPIIAVVADAPLGHRHWGERTKSNKAAAERKTPKDSLAAARQQRAHNKLAAAEPPIRQRSVGKAGVVSFCTPRSGPAAMEPERDQPSILLRLFSPASVVDRAITRSSSFLPVAQRSRPRTARDVGANLAVDHRRTGRLGWLVVEAGAERPSTSKGCGRCPRGSTSRFLHSPSH